MSDTNVNKIVKIGQLAKFKQEADDKYQDQTLATALTIDGESVTTVEGALSALNDKTAEAQVPIMTTAQWEALTADEKAAYSIVVISDGGGSSGGSGTDDYTLLINQPSINNVTLIGNKSLADLGIDIPTSLSELNNDGGFVTDANITNNATIQNIIEAIDNIETDVKPVQYDVMPEATSENVGNIIQYIGDTDRDYTNGHFYKCLSIGSSYRWEEVEVSTVTKSGKYRTVDYSANAVNTELIIQVDNIYTGITSGYGVYIIRARGGEAYLFSVGNDSNDANSAINYQIVQLSAGFNKLSNFKWAIDSAGSGHLLFHKNGLSSVIVEQIAGYIVSKYLTLQTRNEIPSGWTTIDLPVLSVPGHETRLTALESTVENIDTGDENVIESITVNGTPVTVTDKTAVITVITNTVDNLTNYYKKSETYSQAEVDSLVSAAAGGAFAVVNELPTTDISIKTIYLVAKASGASGNLYDEYIYTNGVWEKIGDTQISLTDYQTKLLTAALTIDGTAQTTVEGALSALNTAVGNRLKTADFNTAIADYYTKTQIDDMDLADSTDLTSYQSKTLATPITVDGTSQTTVESALAALNSKVVDVDIATTSVAGIVKPDGVTVLVENDGTIRSDIPKFTQAQWDALTSTQKAEYNYVVITDADGVAEVDIPVFTSAQWDALTSAEKSEYKMVIISDSTASASGINVDNALSLSSTNPVQNSVITSELNQKVGYDGLGTGLYRENKTINGVTKRYVAVQTVALDSDSQLPPTTTAVRSALADKLDVDKLGMGFDVQYDVNLNLTSVNAMGVSLSSDSTVPPTATAVRSALAGKQDILTVSAVQSDGVFTKVIDVTNGFANATDVTLPSGTIVTIRYQTYGKLVIGHFGLTLGNVTSYTMDKYYLFLTELPLCAGGVGSSFAMELAPTNSDNSIIPAGVSYRSINGTDTTYISLGKSATLGAGDVLRGTFTYFSE